MAKKKNKLIILGHSNTIVEELERDIAGKFGL